MAMSRLFACVKFAQKWYETFSYFLDCPSQKSLNPGSRPLHKGILMSPGLGNLFFKFVAHLTGMSRIRQKIIRLQNLKLLLTSS